MFRVITQLKNLSGKRVLVRADFNVPIKNNRVIDDFKIRKSLATIEYLSRHGAKVILVSHLGRPDGKIDKKYSLRPVANCLEEVINKKIGYCEIRTLSRLSGIPFTAGKYYWSGVANEVLKMKNGDILLLENIRFFEGEENNSAAFSKQLAALAEVFVLDGFGVSHRDAASVSGVAKYLPAYAGLLLADEISGLNKVLNKPKKPFIVILGGIKMETKIPVIDKLLPLADYILVGGGIVNTCLWVKELSVGVSLVDRKHKDYCLQLLKSKKIIFPIDVVVGRKNGKDAIAKRLDENFLISNKALGIYDIGPETIRLFAKYIKNANTIVWNGAMGYFEQHPYEHGTHSVARLVAGRAKGKAFGVCGGGETVEVLRQLNLLEDIDLVSTGGGAMLDFLGGKKLPGIEAVSLKH